MEAILDKFGRIVIPKKIRDDFSLTPGSTIRIEEGKNEIVLKPVEGEPSLTEKDGVLVFTGKILEDIDKKIKDIRDERIQVLGGFWFHRIAFLTPGDVLLVLGKARLPFRAYWRTGRRRSCMPNVSSKSEPFSRSANCSRDKSSTVGTEMTKRFFSRAAVTSWIRWLRDSSRAIATRNIAAIFATAMRSLRSRLA